MESASLALSLPRLQKPYLLACGTQRLPPLTARARFVRARTRTQAIEGAAASDLASVQITWQITVGALGTSSFDLSYVICHLRPQSIL